MNGMSRIYTPLGLDGYELCQPVSPDDFETINVEVNGTPRQSNWKPIPMRLIHEDNGQKLTRSDSPWLGSHALVFRTEAVRPLSAVLREYGELLPVVCQGADVFLYNPTRVIDALDEGASSIVRFSSGRIMMVKQHVFKADVVHDAELFKIPNLRVSPTFVSQRFVDQWKASGLRGLDFKLVWPART